MPTIEIDGTKFTFTVLAVNPRSSGYQARVAIGIENGAVRYRRESCEICAREIEEWLVSAARLLAGGYQEIKTVNTESGELAVSLISDNRLGERLSREQLRERDCMMLVNVRLYAQERGGYYGGVYTIEFHREQIEEFVRGLRKEYDAVYAPKKRKHGKYLFAGVSPLGYEGCRYWYFDPDKKVRAGDYVWAEMGRHKRDQICYVDCVEYFDEDSAPYDPDSVSQILGIATDEEVAAARKETKDEVER